MASIASVARVASLLLVAACARESPPPATNGYPQQYPPQQYPPQQYPPQQYPPQQYPPPQQSPPPPAAADLAQACVDSINRHRASLQLPPLARWRDAEACTSQEAQTDGQRNAPHGSFGACKESAQNVCPGWPGPPAKMTEPCVQSMWDEGPGADFQAHGHYLNMINKAYRAVACGYSVQPDGSVWLIQNFTRLGVGSLSPCSPCAPPRIASGTFRGIRSRRTTPTWATACARTTSTRARRTARRS